MSHVNPIPRIARRINWDAPFDPLFTGDSLPDFIPDVSGATIGHIALDCNLRVSLSCGWRVDLDGDVFSVLVGGKPRRLEFIYDDPDDRFLTPDLRALVGQPVTDFHVSMNEGHLSLQTPLGWIAVDGRATITPWEMWGPAGRFVSGVD